MLNGFKYQIELIATTKLKGQNIINPMLFKFLFNRYKYLIRVLSVGHLVTIIQSA